MLTAILSSLVFTGPALASSPLSFWKAPARDGGYEKISAKFYVDPSSTWKTGYYASTQASFAGHDVQYFGIQPREGQYSGHLTYSVFGKGSSVGDPARCSGGADGGAGVSCSLDGINLNKGEWYEIVSAVVEHGDKGRRWNGTLIDSQGKQTYIASFWTDDSYGPLSGDGAQWLEWYYFNGIYETTTPEQRDCQPPFTVKYERPTLYVGDQQVKAKDTGKDSKWTIDDKCAVKANDPNYSVEHHDAYVQINGGIHSPK
ncbi:hypothetical protein A1Q1_06139 [Trichosporon asahii var. asahii CBS 2479]|uniref:Alginate lyase n=1 Tax=Trichosporon asahii var. asahii (strain ATCC 90039 / CBS 2479 / JCM 2466 / KCTC 7840 / NBRC 103889/ NCYC 2677 / UAMH 7654) TaxID=1186058 RepID=J5SFC7_TRIAS|nr:hypothetical protein A1Q1_06139 [Trichosporon asahii var. asahii CBS 2479]EJT45376.1 hypothetical protein A1Q1_06139 [Trichosporon asahii var. asahii CBS 2479]